MGWVRVVLALSVAVWHMPDRSFRFLNAAVAVVCFFIISGFYMAMVINEKYARDDGRPWVMEFYRARLVRLFPAYLFVLALVIAAVTLGGRQNPFTTRLPMPLMEQLSLVVANLAIIGQDLHQTIVRALDQGSGPPFLQAISDRLGPAYFQDSVMLVGQAWSLSSEMLFYLLAPFVVRSARRTVVLLSVALGVRYLLVGVLSYRSGVWGYWFFPGSVCLFLLGSAAYHFRRALPSGRWQVWAGRLALAALAAWFVRSVVASGVVMPPDREGSLDGATFWLFYAAFALAVPLIFEATRHSRRDRMIGELSYPLYLVHGLGIALVHHYPVLRLGLVSGPLAAVLVSLLAAAAIHLFVEAPIERHLRRPTPPPRPWPVPAVRRLGFPGRAGEPAAHTVRPPSTSSTTPVMNSASSEAR